MSARKRCDAGECGRLDWERRIAELEALLRRIDNVTTWETHPLGRGFQEEIEAALGIGEKQASR